MSILVWNVRGLNKLERRDLKDHLTKVIPSMITLVETKVKTQKNYRIVNSILETGMWQIFMNSLVLVEDGFVGIQRCGIVMLLQQITLEASNIGGFKMFFTAVYGSNWHSRRVELWNDLVAIHQQMSATHPMGSCRRLHCG